MSAFAAEDYRYMAQAIQLARKGWFSTHPNPRVGCIIVRDGEIIGQGFHRRAGEPHAERIALANAWRPRGSTAYVTLEPCCHHGRTPPCTEGLIEAGVDEVVVAMTDPNPLVAGKGIAQLQAAGITVRSGLLEVQAQALNPGFIKRMRDGRPRIRCKLACSADGRTAMASGESIWISSEQSRRDVQFLRAESAAIVTGIGTVLADDPSMNVRLQPSDLKLDYDLDILQPLRVILDTELQTPVDAKILTIPGKTLIFCASEAHAHAAKYNAKKVEVLAVDSHAGQLDLAQVMAELARRQINDVLLETGAVLAGSAVQAGLVDELIVYQAPHIMGDAARGLLHLPGLDNMSERIALQVTDRRMIGEDERITFEIKT